jgi:RNA polymerase sigma-70 factor (sigma-E family)
MITVDARVSDSPQKIEGGRLGELYERHASDAVRLAYLLTGDRALAEDLAQEAFVRMYGRFRDLRSPDAFPWYLRRTVVNLANSHFRHAKVARTYVERQGRTPDTNEWNQEIGARQEMWESLSRLPERQRAAIVLRFYEDLTEAQTAEVLGCRLGTVKSLVSRGLDALRKEMSRGE